MVTVKSRTDGSTYARDVIHIKKLKLPVEIRQENEAEHHKNEPKHSETETRNEKITEKNLHHAIVPPKCVKREPTKRFEPRGWCSVYYLFIISFVLGP